MTNAWIQIFWLPKGTGQPILSCKTAVDLGVLQVINNIENTEMPISKQFPNLFGDKIGKLKDYQLKIPIYHTINPIVQQTRRIPYNLRDKLEKMDIIENVDSPTSWVSPIVCFSKKNRDIRLCVDMRQANSAVKRV